MHLPKLCSLWALVGLGFSEQIFNTQDVESADSIRAPVPVRESAATISNDVQVPPLPELDGTNFTNMIQDGYWFVKHYSPWCPHCIAIASIWKTVYESYYSKPAVPSIVDSNETTTDTFSQYYNFHFGSLDCDAFGSICAAYKVEAYPTFILYKNGKEVDRMEGSRDLKGLSDFIDTHLEPAQHIPRPVDKPLLSTTKAAAADYSIQSQSPSGSSTSSISSASSSLNKDSPAKVMLGPASVNGQIPVKNNKPTLRPNLLGLSTPLNMEKFQREVTMSQDSWLIKFYAPWCRHCQAIAPNWIQLAKEMKGKLNIGEVNCDVEQRLCKDVQVRGYPTILFFRGGERVEYIGLRGLGDLVTYANKAIDIGDGVKYVDATKFKELEETEEVIFLYFYDHATTSEDFAALERLTLSLIGHAKLVKTNCETLASRFKITTWPRLLVSRDGRPTYYTALAPQDMRDFRQVLHWMQSVWLPIVPELTASNSREIMDGKLVVLAILTRGRPDEFAMAKKELKSAALEWMDKQTIVFQRERQELRDAKQLRIEEAEDRNDQRALRAAKNIRINMEKSEQKEVGFAWVDGVFWERWIRQTYGIQVATDGEKVIINDEDNRCYWDTTVTGNPIIASRTSILETIPKIVSSPPKIKPKSTISKFEKFFFNIRGKINGHPYFSILSLVGIALGALTWSKGRARRNRGGYFKLDDKDRLLNMGNNGKVD